MCQQWTIPMLRYREHYYLPSRGKLPGRPCAADEPGAEVARIYESAEAAPRCPGCGNQHGTVVLVTERVAESELRPLAPGAWR
jgi:hypothetical protein